MLKSSAKQISISIGMLILLIGMLIVGVPDSGAESRAERAKRKKQNRPTILFSPEIEKCELCHREYVLSMTDGNILGGKHNDATDNCYGCHGLSEIKTAHENVDRPPGKLFRERNFSSELCLRCHDGYDLLVEETKDNKAYTALNGTTMNPHDTHVGKVECFNCHKMHKNKPPIEYCYGCHHTRELRHCKECHSSSAEKK